MASLFGGVLSLETVTWARQSAIPVPPSGEQLFDAAMSHMGQFGRIEAVRDASGLPPISPELAWCCEPASEWRRSRMKKRPWRPACGRAGHLEFVAAEF